MLDLEELKKKNSTLMATKRWKVEVLSTTLTRTEENSLLITERPEHQALTDYHLIFYDHLL
jgi:hypothetical protein